MTVMRTEISELNRGTKERVTSLFFYWEELMDEIKGYWTGEGYMGYVNGTYILFATERDYLEWME